MFHGSQKVVESFFRRTRFRRSKKLRSSFRGSFINRPSSAHRSTPSNQDQVRSTPANQDQGPTTTRSRSERAQFKIKIKRKKSNKMADRVMNTNEDVVVGGGDDDDVVDYVEGEELPLIDRTEKNNSMTSVQHSIASSYLNFINLKSHPIRLIKSSLK
ncbi:hypothetical protein HELRODRAFT_177658 [Helobdella robusta]|uniref:Uncharacterized protein n=1 Tax=Helobdella robusta TaxID=6412 RepID=T1FC11_HELRO|nr:hypothetical protein HELRODRAFT_177658 [Helobdella robusta]ESN97986.1 hypothetical protein HELRODRAFT_177658 [Helobdella robusta]